MRATDGKPRSLPGPAVASRFIASRATPGQVNRTLTASPPPTRLAPMHAPSCRARPSLSKNRMHPSTISNLLPACRFRRASPGSRRASPPPVVMTCTIGMVASVLASFAAILRPQSLPSASRSGRFRTNLAMVRPGFAVEKVAVVPHGWESMATCLAGARISFMHACAPVALVASILITHVRTGMPWSRRSPRRRLSCPMATFCIRVFCGPSINIVLQLCSSRRDLAL